MKIYLDGVEYKTYREIMESCDVKFGCLNYSYIYTRTPKFNLEEECSFLDELMVHSGNLPEVYVDDYIEYLNTHSDMIKFAIEMYTPNRAMLDMECSVEIIPWYFNLILTPSVAISYKGLVKPFVRKKLIKLYDQGTKVHGVNCELPFFDSMNSGTWMRGKAGLISYFNRKNQLEICPNYSRANIGRKLIEEGHTIDLNKIKRGNWEELARMNCLSWKKYQDYKGGV